MHAEGVHRIHNRRKRLDLQQPMEGLLQAVRHCHALAQLALQVPHMYRVRCSFQSCARHTASVHLPLHYLMHAVAKDKVVGVAASDGLLQASFAVHGTARAVAQFHA